MFHHRHGLYRLPILRIFGATAADQPTVINRTPRRAGGAFQSQRLNGNGFSDDMPLRGAGFINAIGADVQGKNPRDFLHFFVIGIALVGNPAGYTHSLIVAGNIGATLCQNVSGKVTGISCSAHRLNGFVKLISQTDRTDLATPAPHDGRPIN